ARRGSRLQMDARALQRLRRCAHRGAQRHRAGLHQHGRALQPADQEWQAARLCGAEPGAQQLRARLSDRGGSGLCHTAVRPLVRPHDLEPRAGADPGAAQQRAQQGAAGARPARKAGAAVLRAGRRHTRTLRRRDPRRHGPLRPRHQGSRHQTRIVLVLSNEEIARLLTIEECMTALEPMYRDVAEERVLFSPRVDNIAPNPHPEAYYAFKHMGGTWPAQGVQALRINSDVVTHPLVAGKPRRVKQPLAPGSKGGRWVGLVLLFSTETGALLAMFPDGVMQRLRVGATSGLGLKRLAREDAQRLALIGGC